MIVYLDAKAEQTLEEFALELAWFASRLPRHIIVGVFAGVKLETIPDILPSEIIRQYHTHTVTT